MGRTTAITANKSLTKIMINLQVLDITVKPEIPVAKDLKIIL